LPCPPFASLVLLRSDMLTRPSLATAVLWATGIPRVSGGIEISKLELSRREGVEFDERGYLLSGKGVCSFGFELKGLGSGRGW
jgi:hypothetical protein